LEQVKFGSKINKKAFLQMFLSVSNLVIMKESLSMDIDELSLFDGSKMLARKF